MYNIQLFYVALGKVSKINQWLVISPAAQPRHDSLSIFPSEIITLRWIGIAAIFGLPIYWPFSPKWWVVKWRPRSFVARFAQKMGERARPGRPSNAPTLSSWWNETDLDHPQSPGFRKVPPTQLVPISRQSIDVYSLLVLDQCLI